MPRMPPPRKEPKEAVVYAASKRKAEPFKPHRPSQVPRTDAPTTQSASFSKAGAGRETAGTAFSRAMGKALLGRKEEEVEEEGRGEGGEEGSESSDEGLGDDPLAVTKTATARTTQKPRSAAKATKKPAAAAARKPKPAIPIPCSSPASSPPRPIATTPNAPPPPTQLADPTLIPLPLLTRLLHSHFANQSTQIDKHALQVVRKYLEVFVREAIARAAAGKREKAKRGEVEGGEARWLEVEDLEGVAPGVMMDF
ncbi:hypothetical protein LTR91_002331 [Friedmanniomyces endolithicus]|uniref:Uncharacterized protein n=1 Tax=Friedmanniomyces endolithicus TaxID=329885 RepID=A0AAN6FP86_9PEZI|nr:hypothetical protein LTR35_005526 [Friedmanniomyces endolithicus]KAK0297556.1 hypothetical protein LTS00_003687 [Friedmanniomyces endolithicus]KAK0312664.1 hypothetical protein LTR01_002324 [Friedmanniomyces endolithicus]KAK0322006.1 hypothetical protein LTR82_006979 [Friedmanniomyces endolithicus]KAK0827379.1 hypothetical protein LTR73_005616 [Friedmanniomyces endolithicus]